MKDKSEKSEVWPTSLQTFLTADRPEGVLEAAAGLQHRLRHDLVGIGAKESQLHRGWLLFWTHVRDVAAFKVATLERQVKYGS